MKYYKAAYLAYPERLQNQRPTLIVPPNVYTSFKEIWIGNVLLLENLLVKFLHAPEPFRHKDAFTIKKFKHLRPCLCLLICTETWQGDGHALTNYHQYSFLSRNCLGDLSRRVRLPAISLYN